jgi:hypothetical protein
LTTCSSCGIFLFVHVVVFEMFVSVLDEKVVDCFLPCFAGHQHHSRWVWEETNSLLIKAAMISSSEAPDQRVLRLPMISSSISSGELTGRSTSSMLGGETVARPGTGRGLRETKKGWVRISGIYRSAPNILYIWRTYGNSPLWVFLEHSLKEVSGGTLDLIRHLEDTNLDLL